VYGLSGHTIRQYFPVADDGGSGIVAGGLNGEQGCQTMNDER
jgi:hypothetical protein